MQQLTSLLIFYVNTHMAPPSARSPRFYNFRGFGVSNRAQVNRLVNHAKESFFFGIGTCRLEICIIT
jgi:hypothetical protein